MSAQSTASSIPLQSGATATAAGTAVTPCGSPYKTFQAAGTTTAGAGAATIKIQVSNDNSNWLDLGTISLTLSTTSSSDGFQAVGQWRYVRSNVTAISGTGASVSAWMGE
jgi:hypothetical protein